MLLQSLIQRVFAALFTGILRLFLGIMRILFRISDEEMAELKELSTCKDPPSAEGTVTLLVPIGAVPSSSLYAARNVLFETFIHAMEITAPIPVPSEAYNERRRQYNALKLIRAVEECMQPDTFRAVGIIDGDIYFPGTNFVFGGRVPGSRTAVIGLKRLYPPRWVEEREGKQLLSQRVAAVAVSQISSSLGLGLCENPGCARGFTNTLNDLDHKTARLCPDCAAKVSEWLKPATMAV